ncbi:AcrR family transcriptional regulator [Arthrobacter sp. CAN_A6]|uniref:TetR family transcriptional regulator n=1 Tax=Arthrobacter sp. CAN_A6 TaxID=2787721 RepID=UPI0018CA63F9
MNSATLLPGTSARASASGAGSAARDTPPGDGRSSRWQDHRTARRRALIKTARRAVDALGPGASMEDIAAAADTSKSVYYRYFGDKTGLQRAVAEVVLNQMQQKVLDAARQAASPREGLRSMVFAYLQMARTSPNVYAFVTRAEAPDSAGGAGEDRAPGTLASFLETTTDMIAEPMRSYLLAAHGPDGSRDAVAEYWPRAAIGMVRAAGELWLSTEDGPGKPSEEQLTDQLTAWLFDGISYAAPATHRSSNQ